jgi:inosine/xanthosine triphosphate pyrophosphatase family protein
MKKLALKFHWRVSLFIHTQLSMEEKNRLSHRARAVMKAKEILKTILDG